MTRRLVSVSFAGFGDEPGSLQVVLGCFTPPYRGLHGLKAESLLTFLQQGDLASAQGILAVTAKIGSYPSCPVIRTLTQIPGREVTPVALYIVPVPNQIDRRLVLTSRFEGAPVRGKMLYRAVWEASLEYGPTGSAKEASRVIQLINSFGRSDASDGEGWLKVGNESLYLSRQKTVFVG